MKRKVQEKRNKSRSKACKACAQHTLSMRKEKEIFFLFSCQVRVGTGEFLDSVVNDDGPESTVTQSRPPTPPPSEFVSCDK